MQAAVLDTRFALRTLRRRPLYAALAVGTLALGIGAATTIYGVVDGVLLEPLPFRESSRLVAVFRTFPHWRERESLSARWDQIWHSYPGFRDWQARQTSFEAVAAWAASDRTLTGLEVAEQVSVLRTSSSLLQVLDVRPALGRFFLPGEDRPPSVAVAVISHEMWTARFGASPSVIGRAVRLDDIPHEIIGVLPPGLDLGRATAPIWVPAGSEPSDLRPGSANFFAIGRLRGAVTLAQAADETRRLVAESALPDPAGARLALWQDEMTKRARRPLLLLLGASAVLLLLACVNVATLMLGEASARGNEFATRAALGAGRGRVARQLLTESLVIAALGVAAGALIARLGTRALVALAPGNVPRLADVALDARVLAAACAAGAVTALLFGLVPAASLMRASPADLLGSAARSATSRRGRWTLGALVATQVALSCLLLIGAALLGSSLRRLSSVDPGFASERLVLVGLGVTGGRHAADAQSVTAFFAEAAARIAAVPGVDRAVVGSAVPFSGGGSSSAFTIEGHVLPPGVAGIEARRSHVLPGFIETFGVRLLAGRTIDGRDRDGAPPVAMVNETMARRFWPSESAIGKRVGYDDEWLTVVGVVSDVKHASLADSTRITVYMPAAQQPTPYLMLLVRTRMDVAALAPLVRRAVAALDPGVPVTRIDAMPALVERSFATERFRAVLIGLFAMIAGVLATVGVYGVTARAVSQQSREIGIRMALGSSAGAVIQLFIARTMSGVAAGVALGLVGAFAASRLLAPYLFGIAPTDPLIFGSVLVLLSAVGLGATWLPARTASRANPAVALRR